MMDDSALFMEWAMDTLEQEHPDPMVVVNGEAAFPSLQALCEQRLVFEELITGANPASSGSSGETTDGSVGCGGNFSSKAAMEHDVWPASPNSARRAPRLSGKAGGTSLPVTSWNFCAASALPASSDGTLDSGSAGVVVPEMVYAGSQPTRRAAARSPTGTGPVSSVPPYAQDHIMAERKRREKINQRFIELSTVIPGLKKMDKATILSDATRHVKELQEKIKALEAATTGRNGRSIETVVLVKKKPRNADAAVNSDQNGSPSSASSSGAPASRNPLPEIEVRFSESGVMVRILCGDVKGVVVRVLSVVEEGLHLSVAQANVMPFTACTVIITITAKVDEGFTVTAEEIVGRLNYVLEQHSSCTSAEELK